MPRKKKTSNPRPVLVSPPRRSVEVRKANNGFVVSSWQAGTERIYIAKTRQEAQKYANKLLGT